MSNSAAQKRCVLSEVKKGFAGVQTVYAGVDDGLFQFPAWMATLAGADVLCRSR
ncbi:MAG: hypothetical protein IKM62_05570 [Kiritimatiellae bacterium]|nr:hypothetical protein [Kiritimatiellia bacterium]